MANRRGGRALDPDRQIEIGLNARSGYYANELDIGGSQLGSRVLEVEADTYDAAYAALVDQGGEGW